MILSISELAGFALLYIFLTVNFCVKDKKVEEERWEIYLIKVGQVVPLGFIINTEILKLLRKAYISGLNPYDAGHSLKYPKLLR